MSKSFSKYILATLAKGTGPGVRSTRLGTKRTIPLREYCPVQVRHRAQIQDVGVIGVPLFFLFVVRSFAEFMFLLNGQGRT
jgi:hypothetical protein